jgi:tetratricopeptide (TPR) repeat protein
MKKHFRKGNAFLGFVNIGRNKNDQFGVHPVWGRIFMLLCALGLMGWVSVAFAGFLFLKHTRDVETGRFADLLLLRWDDFRYAWGEDYIRMGTEMIEGGEVAEGFHYLRIGLIRSPDNIEGRMLLANIFLAQNRTDRASQLLVEGMPYGIHDTDYVTTTMRILLHAERDQEIRELADRFLPAEPVQEDRYLIIAFAAARAGFHRGEFDEAIELINEYQLGTSNSGQILLARIDWERGSHDEALVRLRDLVRRRPDHNEAYIYLTRYHHELGQLDAAERYAVVRQLNDPLTAAPRVDLLYIYNEQGEIARLTREIDTLLRDFRNDSDAIEYLAQFALDTTDPALAQRVFEHAQLRNLNLSVIGIVYVHTLMKAGQYDRATALAERLGREVDGFDDEFGAQILAINAIADYARGDRANAEMQIGQFLSRGNLRPSNYIAYADKLIELGLHEPARRILNHAHRANPRSQSLLNALIRLDILRGDDNALIANVPKLMDMRLPSIEVLNEAYQFLSSDRFLFTDGRHEILERIEDTLRSHPQITLG